MHVLVVLGHFIVAILGVLAIYRLAELRVLPAGLRPGRDLPVWQFALGVLGLVVFELAVLKASFPSVPFFDFTFAYYPAGYALAHQDPKMFHDVIGIGAKGGFVNIPVVAYLFAPFGWLSSEMASLVLTLIGIGFLVATWFLLVRLAKLELRERWLLAFLFLVNGPLLNGIKFANLSYFILFALAAGLLMLREGRSTTAGTILGIAAVIKPPLALFGLFFLLRRDWRGVLGFASVGIATIILSLVVFGFEVNQHWFQTCIVQYSQSWLATFSVQSVPGFILRLNSDAKLLDWIPELPSPGQKLVAQIVTGLIFLVAAAACIGRPMLEPQQKADADNRRDLQYLLVICLCLASSPLAWSHYYAWLLLPTAFFLGSHPPFPASPMARAIGWTAIMLVTPLVGWPLSLSNETLMAIYRSVFLSHLMFGGLLWFFLVAWWLANTGGLLARQDRSAGAHRSFASVGTAQ